MCIVFISFLASKFVVINDIHYKREKEAGDCARKYISDLRSWRRLFADATFALQLLVCVRRDAAIT